MNTYDAPILGRIYDLLTGDPTKNDDRGLYLRAFAFGIVPAKIYIESLHRYSDQLENDEPNPDPIAVSYGKWAGFYKFVYTTRVNLFMYWPMKVKRIAFQYFGINLGIWSRDEFDQRKLKLQRRWFAFSPSTMERYGNMITTSTNYEAYDKRKKEQLEKIFAR